MTFRVISERPAPTQPRSGVNALPRWSIRPLALGIAITVQAGLLYAFLHLADHQPKPSQAVSSIVIIPLGSRQDETSGQASAQIKAEASIAPPVTSHTLPTMITPVAKTEWSHASIPTSDASAQEANAPGLSAATGAVGTGSGSGYDPYAFASYEVPRWVKAQAIGSRTERPGAIAELQQKIRSQTDARNASLALLIMVDQAGKIIQAKLVKSPGAGLGRFVVESIIGFSLCLPSSYNIQSEAFTLTIKL